MARYNYAGKPVVVEEFNLAESGSMIAPLLNSTSGWLQWPAYATTDTDVDMLFDVNEQVTSLGVSFQGIADWIFDTVPTRSADVAWLDIDLKQALTSVTYQDTRFPAYVSLFNSNGGPVGFNISNYQGPLRLGLPALELRGNLTIGEIYKIKWAFLEWPVIPDAPVSLLISRDGGDQWETIATDVKGTEFSWEVSGPVSSECLFKIVDKLDNNIFVQNSEPFSIGDATAVVNDGNNLPLVFHLFPAYPNPFNPTTTISFTLPINAYTILKIHDIPGKEITTLVNNKLSAGKHSFTWNAVNIASGLYFYQLWAGANIDIKKIVLLKIMSYDHRMLQSPDI